MLYKLCKNWISVHQLILSLRCAWRHAINQWKIQCICDFQYAINSIRRSTNHGEPCIVRATEQHQWRQSSMTSFVLNPFAKARTCHFWRFSGNLNPKMLVIVWTSKGTSLHNNACFEPLCVKIHPRVTSVGEVGENKNKKAEGLYFTYFARRSLTADWHKFWVTCSSRGRNQLCKVLS